MIIVLVLTTLLLVNRQWGTSSNNSNGDSGMARIFFPVAFASKCYMAVAVDLITSRHQMYGAMWKSPTTTYFDFAKDSDTIMIPWIAIGN